MPAGRPLEVLVLSDGTGTTAESVTASALVHFEEADCLVKRLPFVRSADRVGEILDDANLGHCVAVTSFVTDGLGQETVSLCEARGVPVIDLMTPVMSMLTTALQRAPEQTPIVSTYLPDSIFEISGAIEFTLEHDDGRGLDTIDQSDLVIYGVSRSGKTPTSIYLACRKLKVANVPIVQGLPLDERARRASPPKVGFATSIERQIGLRRERSGRMGTAIPGYSDRSSILAEIEYCNRIYRSVPGLVTIDVANLAIEEIADWIVRNVL